MTFNWEDYQTIAKELVKLSKKNTQTEAYLRSAISRAYYAAFCKARNRLLTIDRLIIDDDENIHQFVTEEYLTSADQERKSIGNYLKKLRKDRNKADYKDDFVNLETDAKAAIKKADQIMAKLKVI